MELTAGLDHYHRRPQMNIINTSVQYDDTSLPSSCTDLQIPSYDGLPRIPLEQSLLRNNWEQSYFNYNISAPEMSSSDASSAWPMSSETGNSNQYYSYDAGNYEPSLSRDQFGETPRTLPCDGDMYSNGNMSSKVVYEIPSYLVEVDRQGLVDHGLNYSQDAHESSRRFGRPSALAENDVMAQVSFSEHPATSLNPQSESSDDGGHSSRETTAVEAEEHGADEPYAKLIYRALMSVPDHSMVLQDIYQWFRENTTKGSSDTKGWMNSIRHNLSMNAAFKKTERKISGDEIKKSTEWVLEDFAIRDGVQSTTRYRKGNGSIKSVKYDTQVPSRQIPSRRGGLCGGKAKDYRQRAREDRSELRHAAYPRPDTERCLQYHPDHEPIPQQFATRQISPLTPKHESLSLGSPFFHSHPHLKHEHSDISYENLQNYSLGDVHDVCGDGPLFSHELLLNSAHAMCNKPC